MDHPTVNCTNAYWTLRLLRRVLPNSKQIHRSSVEYYPNSSYLFRSDSWRIAESLGIFVIWHRAEVRVTDQSIHYLVEPRLVRQIFIERFGLKSRDTWEIMNAQSQYKICLKSIQQLSSFPKNKNISFTICPVIIIRGLFNLGFSRIKLGYKG